MQVFHARDRTAARNDRPVEIDRCFFCGGFWFDAGELERVTGRDVHPEFCAGTAQRTCAACGESLVPALVRRVRADVCPGCRSVFVEADTVERIAGGELPLRRPGDDPLAADGHVTLTFRCAGCARELPYDEGMPTGRGLACSGCYGALDATPSTLDTSPRRLQDELMFFAQNRRIGSWGGWGWLLWKIFRD
ncbi:MAG: zf-TFIIB domain-containing protein [Myxococcaceae bacterium]|nr:zf-TFIIB domain-containing protein [Myxococcaceae bacterium]